MQLSPKAETDHLPHQRSLLPIKQFFLPALSPHLPPLPLAGSDVLPTLWGQFQGLLLKQVCWWLCRGVIQFAGRH